MDTLPIEICQEIMDFVNAIDWLSAIRFRQISKFFYNLEFQNLLKLREPYCSLLDDKFVYTHPFIRHLDIRNNKLITDLSYMHKLKTLDAWDTNLDDESIRYINPTHLYIRGNYKIRNINHMTNLVTLEISETEIENSGIKGINSKEIDMSHSTKITDLSHMTNLVKINARSTNISEIGLRGLINLEILDATSTKISDLTQFTKLRKLHISRCSNITQKGIMISNLTFLNIANTHGIKDLNHLPNLSHLDISGSNCGVGNEGIKNLTNLTSLITECNNKISELNHLTKLVMLDISGPGMTITDRGIQNLNLSILSVRSNEGIKKFRHMTNLTKLNVSHRNDMFIYDIINCTNLVTLVADFTHLSEPNGLTNLTYLSISYNPHIEDDGLHGLNLISLNVSKCKNVRNLNTITTLRRLNISGKECGVSDSGITDLNLEHLYCENNIKVSQKSKKWWHDSTFEIIPYCLKY